MQITKEKIQTKYKYRFLWDTMLLTTMLLYSMSFFFYGGGEEKISYWRIIPLATITVWFVLFSLMTRRIYGSEIDADSKVQNFEITISEIRESVSSVSRTAEQLMSGIHDQQELVRSIGDELHSHLWLVNAGVDVASIPMIRFVPVRIYLPEYPSDRRMVNTLLHAIYEITEEVGFQKADEFPEQSGSWWKTLVLKTKKALTHKEVQDLLAKLERAADINYLDKPQAEANKAQAEGTSSLILALNSTSNACIQVGSLLLVKVTSSDGKACTIARTLSNKELKHLEENQAMLRNPEQILGWLQQTSKKQIPKSAKAT